jgi:hypothetical protein
LRIFRRSRSPNEVIALAKEKQITFMTTLAVYESFSRRRLENLDFLNLPLLKNTMPPWFAEELRTMVKQPLKEDQEQGKVMMTKALRIAQDNVRKLWEAGILIAAGTDAPYPGVWQGEGLHRELELLVEAGLTPLQALTAATRNAAQLMNAQAEWGTLEPGKLADLLVVDGHPERNIGDTRNITMVMKEGTFLDREHLRFDQDGDPGFRAVGGTLANHEN